MLHRRRLYDRRELLRTVAASAVLGAAGCTTAGGPAGPECDRPADSGVSWIPDVAHPVAWGEEHLTTADGAPRPLSIYYPSPRFLPPRPMLRSCIGRWPIVLLLHGQPPRGVSLQPTEGYNRRFSRIAVALARSGYVVIAPLHGALLPIPEAAPALISAAIADVEWVRNSWHEAKWVARGSMPVTVIGHSYGALQAARIAAGWPEIGALISLSGPYLELNDVAALIASIRCPSLFMFSQSSGVEFERIEDNPNPNNNFWRSLSGDRYAAIFNGEHFDYLEPSASGSAPRGHCAIGQLVADLSALFVASTVQSLTQVPVELSKPNVTLSNAQEALAIQHLPAIDKPWGESCRIRLKWRVGGSENARWIG